MSYAKATATTCVFICEAEVNQESHILCAHRGKRASKWKGRAHACMQYDLEKFTEEVHKIGAHLHK
jgi:hypothetical protein